MKKKIVSMLFVASVAVASAQAGQTTTSTEAKQKTTHKVHKTTTSTETDNPGRKKSTYKKHYGWKKGKHKGNAVGVKQTKTTTTTTTKTP